MSPIEMVKSMAEDQDKPVFDPKDKWIGIEGVRHIIKAIVKFVSNTTALSGLSRTESIEHTKAIGEYPHDADATSRLAWLKFYLKACQLSVTLLTNTIKKLESQ